MIWYCHSSLFRNVFLHWKLFMMKLSKKFHTKNEKIKLWKWKKKTTPNLALITVNYINFNYLEIYYKPTFFFTLFYTARFILMFTSVYLFIYLFIFIYSLYLPSTTNSSNNILIKVDLVHILKENYNTNKYICPRYILNDRQILQLQKKLFICSIFVLKRLSYSEFLIYKEMLCQTWGPLKAIVSKPYFTVGFC